MKKLFLSLVLLVTITACASTVHAPKAFIEIDSSKVNFNELEKKTKIRDCNWGFLHVQDSHDIKTLMHKNNVSKISWIDYEFGNVLLFAKHCVIIYAD